MAIGLEQPALAGLANVGRLGAEHLGQRGAALDEDAAPSMDRACASSDVRSATCCSASTSGTPARVRPSAAASSPPESWNTRAIAACGLSPALTGSPRPVFGDHTSP